MKNLKFLLVAILATVIGFSGYCAEPTSEDVDNYKASIISYLKSEGYMPKYDSDGDIAFKHDGDTYCILASAFNDGYYVTVMTWSTIAGYNLNKIRKAMDKTARSLKFVKFYTSEDEEFAYVTYSWYCLSMADFKRIFSDVLNVLSTADARFVENYIEQL